MLTGELAFQQAPFSREQRAQTEEALKAGQLPAVVATSSLELGIDMGAVDLVIQVEAPPSVAGRSPFSTTPTRLGWPRRSSARAATFENLVATAAPPSLRAPRRVIPVMAGLLSSTVM